MFDETTPYTVLVEDNELKVEPRYYEEHWKGREVNLRRIQELVGLDDRTAAHLPRAPGLLSYGAGVAQA